MLCYLYYVLYRRDTYRASYQVLTVQGMWEAGVDSSVLDEDDTRGADWTLLIGGFGGPDVGWRYWFGRRGRFTEERVPVGETS